MHSDVCVMKNNKIKIYLIGSTRVAFYQRERVAIERNHKHDTMSSSSSSVLVEYLP